MLSQVGLAPDVNVEELARRMDGYSGADITNVCRDAAMMPMREKLMQLSATQMKNISEGLHSTPSFAYVCIDSIDEFNRPVTMADFSGALAKISPSVSPHDLERFVLPTLGGA